MQLMQHGMAQLLMSLTRISLNRVAEKHKSGTPSPGCRLFLDKGAEMIILIMAALIVTPIMAAFIAVGIAGAVQQQEGNFYG